jgi:hypothetical protein
MAAEGRIATLDVSQDPSPLWTYSDLLRTAYRGR